MSSRSWSQLILVLNLLAIILLGGCGHSLPTQYYILTPLPVASSQQLKAVAAEDVAIGVGPVILASYLDRDEIVVRKSQNALDLSELDHWAEPLKDNFARVLGENLSLLVRTDYISSFPWRRDTPITYQVVVEVDRFDIEKGEQSILVAQWRILSGNGERILFAKKSSFKAPADTQAFEAGVAALNQNLNELSREIADAIRQLL